MFSRDNPEARLSRVYAAMEDEPLLHLAARPEELTELARELVLAEVRRRKLTLHHNPPVQPVIVDDEIDEPTPAGEPIVKRELWYARPGDYAERAAPDCIFPLPDQPDLLAVRVALTLADIPFDEFFPAAKLDLREPFLAVRPADRERAREVLSNLDSADVQAQVAAQQADPDDWSPPCCPVCRAADPLLTTTTPRNTWLCDECGHTWVEVDAH